jgi:hypothetical protein
MELTKLGVTKVGRPSSFEVTVNGKYLAFSKLASGAFPQFDALARTVRGFDQSGAVPADWKELRA